MWRGGTGKACTVGPISATPGVVWQGVHSTGLIFDKPRPSSKTDEDDWARVWCGGVQASWRGGDEGE